MITWLKNLIKRSVTITYPENYSPVRRLATPVTSETVWGLPAFNRAVDIVASTCAACKIHTYKRGENSSRERAAKYPSEKLLNFKPNSSLQTPFTFFRTLISNTIWAGNGYAIIKRDYFNDPVGLYLVDPEAVTLDVIYDGYIPTWYYDCKIDGKQIFVSQGDMIHLRSLSECDGHEGMKLIDRIKMALSLGLSTINYGEKFFTGSMVKDVVTYDKPLKSAEEIERVRVGLAKKASGLEHAHELLILEQATFNRYQASNADAEFLASRQFNLIDVANGVGCPANWLGANVSTSWSSVDAENTWALNTSFNKHLVNLEQELNLKLIREEDREEYYIEFDRSSLTAGDESARDARIREDFIVGLASFEECRQRKNLSTYRDPTQYWQTSVQAMPDSTPEPQPQPQTQAEPQADTTLRSLDAMKPIIAATVNRLITRLQKDKDVYLNKHTEVFYESLPNCQRSLDNFFQGLEEELKHVLPEQRSSIINNINQEKLIEGIWKELSEVQI